MTLRTTTHTTTTQPPSVPTEAQPVAHPDPVVHSAPVGSASADAAESDAASAADAAATGSPNGHATTRRARRWSMGPSSQTLRSAAVTAIALVAVVAIWSLASRTGLLSPIAPTPGGVARRAAELLSDPFYQAGPASVGLFWHAVASLRRVLTGFVLALAVAIPAGIVAGTNPVLRRGVDPLVQILRPVSPLAWLPLGLALLRDAEHTAVFVIVLSALWPTFVATVQAVRTIDPTYIDLANTLGTGALSRLINITIPAALPGIVTGVRLSLSTSWLVIIAAEMLVGGRGMGFFLWNMWNRLDTNAIVVAIVIIGLVGWALDSIISSTERLLRYA